MKRIKPRIPEGEAIEDTREMTMEQYSETMKKQLGKEYIRFADKIIREIDPLRNAVVLEIGPGPGWAGINLLLKRSDLRLKGIEISVDMVRVAAQNAKKEGLADRTQYMTGTGEHMVQIPDHYFDLVISRDSLHHWTDPEKIFREIKRVLKPDGKLLEIIHSSSLHQRRNRNHIS
jgi:ubiquinone/menaquinone biosynthesis C-methylase UbiE